MKYFSILCALFLSVISSSALARPVSYPGGWMAMQMNDAASNALQIEYSPTNTYSIGYTAEYWREEEWQLHGLAFNKLLKRWNNHDSQGNLYLISAAGLAYSDFDNFDNKTEAAGFAGLEADWEDRRFYTSYENRLIYAGDIDKEFRQKARVGVAPYIGEYGDLHTWLMLQVDHAPSDKDHFTVTPLVRLFKGTNLLEAGVSNKGTVLFNFTHTF